MKYNICGFSQEKLIEFGLDVVDAELLRWAVDFHATGKMKRLEVDGTAYHWINYAYAIKQLPILGINNPEIIGRRFRKIATAGILKYHIQRLGKGKGTVTWWAFTDAYQDLIQTTRTTAQEQEPTPQNDTDDSKVVSNERVTDDRKVESDSSIRNSSIINTGGDKEDITRSPSRGEPESETQPAPPVKKISREQFRNAILAELRKNNPVIPEPHETDYAEAERLARICGGSAVYLDWLTDASAHFPTKKLIYLHEDKATTLYEIINAKQEREETKKRHERQEASKCPHGRLSRDLCRQCFEANNEYIDNPFENIDFTPPKLSDEERDELATKRREELAVVS